MKRSILKIVSLVLLVILSTGCFNNKSGINLEKVSTHEFYDLYVDIPDELKLTSDYAVESSILPYSLSYKDSQCKLNLSSIIVEEVDYEHLREDIEYYLKNYMLSSSGKSDDVSFVEINEYEWCVSSSELEKETYIYYCTYYNGRSYTIVYKYDNSVSETINIWKDINTIIYDSLKFR